MKTEEIRQFEEACLWALSKNAPEEAKVLMKEITRRKVDYSGNVGWLYETPPDDRIHKCVEKNMAGVPVDWVEYDERYGYFLTSTNVYGDGAVTDINFCPFCGEKLEKPVE